MHCSLVYHGTGGKLSAGLPMSVESLGLPQNVKSLQASGGWEEQGTERGVMGWRREERE